MHFPNATRLPREKTLHEAPPTSPTLGRFPAYIRRFVHSDRARVDDAKRLQQACNQPCYCFIVAFFTGIQFKTYVAQLLGMHFRKAHLAQILHVSIRKSVKPSRQDRKSRFYTKPRIRHPIKEQHRFDVVLVARIPARDSNRELPPLLPSSLWRAR